MSTSESRVEWVEIIEPRTKEHMYANLTTGECVWDPPEGVCIKRTDASQWWELFDTNTCRFYYYNVASQKTVWHRPQNCDIIPLAKLQTLKQNTDPGERKDGGTLPHHHTSSSRHHGGSSGTVGKSCGHRTATGVMDYRDRDHHRSSSSGHRSSSGSHDKRSNSDLLASPQGRHSLQHRLPPKTTEAGLFSIGRTGSTAESHKLCRHVHPGNAITPTTMTGSSTGTSSRSSHRYLDSGKSSDSSLSSMSHGFHHRRMPDGGSLRIGPGTHGKKHSGGGAENCYRMLQESSSSHNIPHSVPSSSTEKLVAGLVHHSPLPPPHQMLSYSMSNSSDLAAGAGGNLSSPSHSMSTPQFKKKFMHDGSGLGSKSGSSVGLKDGGLVSKHESFDYSGNPSSQISLTRSGSFLSSAGITSAGPMAGTPVSGRPYHHHQSGSGGGLPPQQQPPHGSSSHRKGSFDGNNGGAASDDSMHEKYFKSVENTPISRRRHTTTSSSKAPPVQQQQQQKHSSDSSPQSPISPQQQQQKIQRPSALAVELSPGGGAVGYNKSSHKSNDSELFNLDLTSKPEKYLDKMKIDRGKVSPSSISMGGGSATGSGGQSLQKQSSSSGKLSSSQTEMAAQKMAAATSKDQFSLNLNKPNLERHNKEMQQQKQQQQQQQTLEKKSGSGSTHTVASNNSSSHKQQPQQQQEKKKSRNNHNNQGTGFDFDYDNGNTSPLYCNWDKEKLEHLLPLQHYILEQAKLSGCYGFGDAFRDSDSFHSDSQSEHSFSGHEPDNEDSDHSDGHGDYLSHYPYEEYGVFRKDMDGGGVSYYNFDFNFGDREEKEDISEEVTAKLESIQDQIYSPVKNHPPLHKYSPFHAAKQSLESSGFGSDSVDRGASADSSQASSGQPQQQKPSAVNKATLLQRFQENLMAHSPGSMGIMGGNGKIAEMALLKECDIEKFAQDNLNLHSKGIFRKKSSIQDMLSWTPNAISRPMLSLARDKAGKKMATELFKLVQIYMGDRKARVGMSLNSVAIDIITMAMGQAQLRDELYIQMCRQTTENPSRDSLIRGWELMAICLSFVPPSPTFQPALLGYINRHRDPSFATSFPEVGKWPIHVQISHYATIACRRLDRIGSSGRKQAKKPGEDDINQAREQIFRDSMFGNTLHEVMLLQKDKFPERQLPWIQTTLSEQVLLLNGKQTEGIFRVPADVDEVNLLKNRIDRWEFPENKGTMDAHAPASLLKLWYRELYDPLIPDELYDQCVATEDPAEAAAIVEKLPKINRLVLTYLVHFLQQFSLPDVVANTKMDSSNLAMVFAPNLLRCQSQDPKVILENARKEMTFMRTLIQHMDTASVAHLV